MIQHNMIMNERYCVHAYLICLARSAGLVLMKQQVGLLVHVCARM